jgi:segregation and condensation protein A
MIIMSNNTEQTKHTISKPPLDLLFNPSILSKKDVWDINVKSLLEMLLKLLSDSGRKDLRVCGIAALSSSLIHRLKVESIFRLEKIATMRRGIESAESDKPVPHLKSIEIPYRLESAYPVTLEELLNVLENMIMDLANPRKTTKQLNLEAVQNFDFNEYLVKFEQIVQSYEEMIFDIVSADKFVLFRKLTEKMDKIEIVRCFIAVLYLALKGKILINQEDDGNFMISYQSQPD